MVILFAPACSACSVVAHIPGCWQCWTLALWVGVAEGLGGGEGSFSQGRVFWRTRQAVADEAVLACSPSSFRCSTLARVLLSFPQTTAQIAIHSPRESSAPPAAPQNTLPGPLPCAQQPRVVPSPMLLRTAFKTRCRLGPPLVPDQLGAGR